MSIKIPWNIWHISMQYQLIFLYHCIISCMLHGHQILYVPHYYSYWEPLLQHVVKMSSYIMTNVRTRINSPYILDICRFMAFKYKSHVTGHQIYDEIITYHRKLPGLCQKEVPFSFWSDILAEKYIFVPFTSYYLSFDTHLVSSRMLHEHQILCPGNTRHIDNLD